MNVVKRERMLYEEVWGIPGYGDFSPGEQYLPAFLDMVPPLRGGTVLDAGCGSGKGALALQQAGFTVTCLDITDEGLLPEAYQFPFIETPLWESLAPPHDYVYCTDVLEHIPPQFTMLVVQRLREVATLGVFLSISLMPDQFGVFLGQPLHQTVQPYSWWLENLSTLGEVIESRDLGITGLYFLRGAA
jgi:SAM-dependent methyltransferase